MPFSVGAVIVGVVLVNVICLRGSPSSSIALSNVRLIFVPLIPRIILHASGIVIDSVLCPFISIKISPAIIPALSDGEFFVGAMTVISSSLIPMCSPIPPYVNTVAVMMQVSPAFRVPLLGLYSSETSSGVSTELVSLSCLNRKLGTIDTRAFDASGAFNASGSFDASGASVSTSIEASKACVSVEADFLALLLSVSTSIETVSDDSCNDDC